MPAVTAAPDLAARLADLALPEADGGTIALGTLWKRSPVVLVHLRHFGWLFCREQVAQLRTVEEDIARAGATIAAVGTGDSSYARDFKVTAAITFPLLVDDEHVSYRAVGAGRTSLTALARPVVMARGVRAVAQGARQGRRGKAPLLLGATHVIRPDGTVSYAWRNDDVSDTAPVDAVLDALR